MDSACGGGRLACAQSGAPAGSNGHGLAIRRRGLTPLPPAPLAGGPLAAGQRHYYSGNANCAKAGTIAVTILAGPLNYTGVNPKLSCPRPSN